MRSLLRHDEARQLRGHLRRLGPVPAGPDGHELAHQLRAAQERPAGDHPDPPGAGGAAQGGPRHHLRPDRVPGAGAEGRPDPRRVLARRRPTCCAARWARRSRRSSTRSSSPSRRAPAKRGYSDEAIQAVWDVLVPVRRLRVQQGALLRVRPGLVLDRVSQGQLPGRVHGGAAHLGARTTRTSRPSTSTSAAGWASRCCRPTSTSPTHNFTAQGDDVILFGLTAVRNVGYERGGVDHPVPQVQGEVRLLPRLPRQGRGGRLQQAHRRIAHQGRRLRHDWATPARASPSTSRR